MQNCLRGGFELLDKLDAEHNRRVGGGRPRTSVRLAERRKLFVVVRCMRCETLKGWYGDIVSDSNAK